MAENLRAEGCAPVNAAQHDDLVGDDFAAFFDGRVGSVNHDHFARAPNQHAAGLLGRTVVWKFEKFGFGKSPSILGDAPEELVLLHAHGLIRPK